MFSSPEVQRSYAKQFVQHTLRDAYDKSIVHNQNATLFLMTSALGVSDDKLIISSGPTEGDPACTYARSVVSQR